MENKLEKKHIIIPLILSSIIILIGKLNIDFYFKTIMFPFFIIVLSSTLYNIKEKNINKNAYFMLIPIILIIFSNVIFLLLNEKIDGNNEILNVFMLPILISMYLFMLTNKDYKIAFNNILLPLKLFPSNLFKNLNYIKLGINRSKSKNIVNIVLGIILGTVIGIVLLFLLSSADDYFSRFISKLAINLDINIDVWLVIKFIMFFTILFSININLSRYKNLKLEDTKLKNIDKTIVIISLSIINFVFILFLLSELSKLCGNFLKIPFGYIYSSYAREGFFQLLFVTIINFSIILYLIYKTNLVKENKIVKILILILISFSILLIFNSYYRMFLYIEKFGFTVLRLQVILFLFMELILFAVVLKKILGTIRNDKLIFLIILIITYIINLYMCNDLFVKIIN